MSRYAQRSLTLLLIFLVACLVAILVWPVKAVTLESPALQPTPFLTPTPRGDGRIIYIVQEDDNPWRIAAIAGISVEELLSRNGLQPDEFILPGMELELGLAGPVAPTSPPLAALTPTSVPPTATPVVGTGEICVVLFMDENGNGRWEEDEGLLPGGRVSVADVNGVVAGEHTTDLDPEHLEGYCFSDLENGDYNVSAAVPPDHNPTTVMNLPVRLEPGEINHVQFGAQPSSAIQDLIGEGGGGRSTLLGLLGLFLLIAGGGLGYYATRLRRGTPRSLR
ncbi:MAG: LysM peptidoglycan-binding domain-containing protein [Anaerolineales bacterium]|nr:LysM peptidoglycan-binding domain-containing protein [Anaerolineales bacterium]